MQRKWITVVGLLTLMVIGSALRLAEVTRKSISHPEMYVPGIRLPDSLSEPRQRLTLKSVITGTFSSDTHPPGYYVAMWFWTRCFGTSIWSLRVPSVLLGIGSIGLVFWLGVLIRHVSIGWLAAALLAFNGYAVFWTSVARMFSLACFLGLLATLLLVFIARQPRPSRVACAAYVLTLLAGLTVHVFFWLVLATHVLWTLLNTFQQARASAVIKLQILVTILGTPLLAFSAYQSANTVAVLSDAIGVYGREFVGFSFLFPLSGFSFGVFLPEAPYPPADESHLSAFRIGFTILCTVLLVLGIARLRRSSAEPVAFQGRGPSGRSYALATLLATATILAFVLTAERFIEPQPTIRITRAMTVLPAAIAVIAVLLERLWRYLPRARVSAVVKAAVGGRGLVVMMAFVPLALLSALSLVKPMLNGRGLLFVSPYLLLVLAAGIVWVWERARAAGVALLVFLAVTHAISIRRYSQLAMDPADMKRFVAQLAPQVHHTDLLFLNPSWYATPVLYYLDEDRYHLVGRDYDVAAAGPDRRIWVLRFYDEAMPAAMQAALQPYHQVGVTAIPHASATLYVRSPAAALGERQ